jgi:hypothetical protein
MELGGQLDSIVGVRGDDEAVVAQKLRVLQGCAMFVSVALDGHACGLGMNAGRRQRGWCRRQVGARRGRPKRRRDNCRALLRVGLPDSHRLGPAYA